MQTQDGPSRAPFSDITVFLARRPAFLTTPLSQTPGGLFPSFCSLLLSQPMCFRKRAGMGERVFQINALKLWGIGADRMDAQQSPFLLPHRPSPCVLGLW